MSTRGFIDPRTPGGSGAAPFGTATTVDPDGAPGGLPAVARSAAAFLLAAGLLCGAAVVSTGCGSAALQWGDAPRTPQSPDLPEEAPSPAPAVDVKREAACRAEADAAVLDARISCGHDSRACAEEEDQEQDLFLACMKRKPVPPPADRQAVRP